MNKYLEKIAEEIEKAQVEPKHLETTAKSAGRSILEGLGGAAAGAVVGGLASRWNPAAVTALSGVGGLVGGIHGQHASLKNSLSNKKDYNVQDPNSAAWRAQGRGLLYSLPGSILGPIGTFGGHYLGNRHSIENTERDGK